MFYFSMLSLFLNLFISKFSGFFVGCTAALIVSLILIIRARHLLDLKEEGAQYMENMFPLYR